MGMKSRIATEVLDAITAEANADSEREICGLLLGSGCDVTAHRSARNVAPDTRRRFEIDPAILLGAHRAERQGGPSILGCYHSHPIGSPMPSALDAADAEPNGWLWLILGRENVRLWRAVQHGVVHGRFNPVPLACIPSAEPPESALSFEANR